jgi:hypothetical protein
MDFQGLRGGGTGMGQIGRGHRSHEGGTYTEVTRYIKIHPIRMVRHGRYFVFFRTAFYGPILDLQYALSKHTGSFLSLKVYI